jgi:hypothetical protein
MKLVRVNVRTQWQYSKTGMTRVVFNKINDDFANRERWQAVDAKTI